MRLTLDIDGKLNSVVTDDKPTDRLKAMQDMCILLDAWATERDKDKPN
jgi:hypothetical protein